MDALGATWKMERRSFRQSVLVLLGWLLVPGAIAQEYGLLSGGFERGALEDNGGVNGASESGPPFSGDDALRGGVTEGEDRQG